VKIIVIQGFSLKSLGTNFFSWSDEVYQYIVYATVIIVLIVIVVTAYSDPHFMLLNAIYVLLVRKSLKYSKSILIH